MLRINEIADKIEDNENFIMLMMMDSSKYSFKKRDEDFVIYKNGNVFSSTHILFDNSIVMSHNYRCVYDGDDADEAVEYLLDIIKKELQEVG